MCATECARCVSSSSLFFLVCVCDGDMMTRDDECVYESTSSCRDPQLLLLCGKENLMKKSTRVSFKKIVSQLLENGCVC